MDDRNSKIFICPKCNKEVGTPTFTKEKPREPRCENGHKVVRLDAFGSSLMAWAVGLTLFVPAYYWVTGLLPAISSAFAVVTFVLRLGIPWLAVMGIVEIAKGIGYGSKLPPVKGLMPGAIGQGIGMLVGAIAGGLAIYLLFRPA